jgi:hypothetical protein
MSDQPNAALVRSERRGAVGILTIHEIRVGIMPGAGGTQRLLRTVGRYKTLLWTLTGT